MGKKWSIIAKKLRGRTENAVKNRFHAIFRKHLEKRGGGASTTHGDIYGEDDDCEEDEEDQQSSGNK